MKSTVDNPILFELFKEIQKNSSWITPGLQEYYLFLEFLQSGYSINSFDEMAFVLETLWLKSHNQRDKFRAFLNERKSELMSFADSIRFEENIQEKKDHIPAEFIAKTTPSDSISGENPNNYIQENKPEYIGDRENILHKEENEETELGGAGFSLGELNEETARNHVGVPYPKESEIENAISIPYLFTNDYLPINNRMLIQGWRTLNSDQEGREFDEFDIPKTIFDVAQQGYFSDFIYKKELHNNIQPFMLVDQSDSMIAMESFGKALYECARISESHQTLQSWYFNNLPMMDDSGDYRIWDELCNHFTIGKQLRTYSKQKVVIMIYSDAGCLRDENNPERIEKTKKFLDYVAHRSSYLAWLNPAPRTRWRNTNAEAISTYCPMFESNRIDFDNAMAALKGRIYIKR